MDNLSRRLNCKIDLYAKTKTENELGEVDFTYSKIKSLYAEIKPVNGAIKTLDGDLKLAEMSYKFTIRSNAIKNLDNTMYFIYKGQKYNIEYHQANFKYKDSTEIFCKMEVE